MLRNRVLFLLKHRENTWGCDYSGSGPSSGLLNSAKFVKDMLIQNGVSAKLVEVVDANSIDREVTRYRPTHVVIEALWVLPSKFEVLSRLHPKVIWIIRNHSQIPFLANEGIAMERLLDYVSIPRIVISNNSPKTNEDFRFLVSKTYPSWDEDRVESKVIYLPNFYPLGDTPKRKHNRDRSEMPTFDVGCFGAIRPLKNQLLQAVAALQFCDEMGFRLRFHINSSRVEGRGDAILKNLRALFLRVYDRAELVEHPWMDHPEFLKLVGQMDMGLQVSYTETFNIVGADFVSQNVPIVGTEEMPWMPLLFSADPNDVDNVVCHMKLAYWYKRTLGWLGFNAWRRHLRSYARHARRTWLSYLG